MLAYTVLVWGLTLVFAPVAGMGVVYLAAAVVLGGVFTGLGIDVLRRPEPARAMRLFGWSITYVVLLFGAMAVDELARSGF
jgi:protoheme IX farnesyltransferase